VTLAIDHEKVRQSGDRTWALELLDEVRSPSVSPAERDDAFKTLAHVEDPRSIVPLTDIVEDPSLGEAVRDAASRVVAGFDDCTTGERRSDWWKSGDPVMMAHALRLVERSEADVVLPVAGDDAHPLQMLALLALTWGFDEPQFQAVKIRALGHPAAEVRRAAAAVLMWDEPVAAERALLTAAADTSSEVAIAAIDTLQYYPSRRVLRAAPGSVLIGWSAAHDQAMIERVTPQHRTLSIVRLASIRQGLAMTFDATGSQLLYLIGHSPPALWIADLGPTGLTHARRLIANSAIGAEW